ncbi:hypothetical protein CYMTET_16879 [Cymbomonas tetramitiformis]|uniref:Uncharacterized protein n=1 Tax=Cymbomonas tetramitiformis TaxID=36881 RepID=A0AAE0C2B2_9CHLO|nr:hypothetical protein CYMTET_44009 [Cymbomonas tetramitiformis]KAK3274972.1 hypothetical protein CYMTET_16879 [Cymbomonas tetramitiformis]
MPSRRCSLSTIFDNAAARHAATPPTPAQTAAPAGETATAVFVAAVRVLMRSRFDESVAKHIAKKCLGSKDARLVHNTERDASLLLARIVPALEEIFVTQDAAFAPLFVRFEHQGTVSAHLIAQSTEYVKQEYKAKAEAMACLQSGIAPRERLLAGILNLGSN